MTRQAPDAATFEKLGAFYLGREYDLEGGGVRPDLVLYDAKDLTTHAVCVGMTGSGKTGLCLSLLEEAAIDGIPAIAIDPKGDLGNLLLTFPELRPADFRPWIEDAEAARKGVTPDEFATSVATKWRDGLAEWGQDGARIARLRSAADFAIYTPGSSAGLPVNVLRSFAAPPPELVSDADALGERAAAAVSGLLALLGVEADPVQSREHILLSILFRNAWQEGRDLDLGKLIAEIQSPPVEQVGVMNVETFYPGKERFQLAMRLNNLLASPGFASWLEGEALEIPRLLWTADGRPRVAILSIAHLSDVERMFFVTVLLNELIAWMRTQPGTASLRALLYMDEVFGYFPPTANPPSKTPMLTLLKQARAYGLGVVLATQNPVDLDYKGLSNAGTWFLGRLQTERDKLRVIEGLEGASAAAGAGFDRQRMERTLAGLTSRVFLMNNVHDDRPVLLHTRWVLSYLRGPMTRVEIETLMAPRKAASPPPPPPTTASTATPRARVESVAARPSVPPEVTERFQASGSPPAGARLRYHPALLGTADLHYANARVGVDLWQTVACVAPLDGGAGAAVWGKASCVDASTLRLVDNPDPAAEFAALPARAAKPKGFQSWEKSFKTYLYKERRLTLYACPALKLTSEAGETDGQFRIRAREAAREVRDGAVEKLRERYAPKLARLQQRMQRAQDRVGREQSQHRHQQMQTAISVGATVLGALFGRKAASVGTVGRATTAMRGASRAAREKQDIARAQRELQDLQQQLQDLEAEFQEESAAVADLAADELEITEREIAPRKTDIAIGTVALLWVPWWVSADGTATPASE